MSVEGCVWFLAGKFKTYSRNFAASSCDEVGVGVGVEEDVALAAAMASDLNAAASRTARNWSKGIAGPWTGGEAIARAGMARYVRCVKRILLFVCWCVLLMFVVSTQSFDPEMCR